MKRKRLLFLLELIFVLSIIIGGVKVLDDKKYGRIVDADEVAWIFAGYYFNLYFVHFDLFHPDWKDYEAFDHPPLTKYIVGGSLYVKGYSIDSLDAKRFWNNIPINKFPIYFEFVKHKIPNPTVVIPFTRSIIFGFALSSLILIYVFVRNSYGAIPAVVSTLLIMVNPIFRNVSPWILAEPVLLFFFVLFILLCVQYLKSQENIYFVLGFVVSSLAFLTKLNGILVVGILIILFLAKNRFSIWNKDSKFVIIGLVAFLLISLLLNPVFLNNGIGAIWKMIEVRLLAFRHYQEVFKDVALVSVGERFTTAARMIFFRYSVFYHQIKIPVELVMFILGVYYIFWKKELLLVTVLGFLVILPISILPYNTIKYFYWIFPFTCIIGSLSINLLKEVWDKKRIWMEK
ncbi:MAG: glycosyltransferase family 39 protein [Thermodesulfobacteriota bacterium]